MMHLMTYNFVMHMASVDNLTLLLSVLMHGIFVIYDLSTVSRWLFTKGCPTEMKLLLLSDRSLSFD